ncbi:MAG: hypothetical protein KDA25_01875 [Phycisphaerales bacterium]|nr:hypothetical protein [Phycisphaerales bacterium]
MKTRRRPHRPPPRLAMLGAIGVLALGACSGTDSTDGVGMSLGDRASIAFDRMVSADNGLEVRRWTVGADPLVVAAAVLPAASGEATDEAMQARLDRNGFRLLRVPLDSLESIRAALGSIISTSSAWHGQILDWREIATRPMELGGQAVFVNGRAVRLEPGTLRLIARAWTTPTLDGPVLYVELVPEYAVTPVGGRARGRNRAPATIVLDPDPMIIELDPAYAYLLVCETPGVRWRTDDPTTGAAAATGAPAVRREVESGAVGPDVDVPRTVGEALLLGRGRGDTGSRDVLILVPRVPAFLEPPTDTPTDPPVAGEDA